MDKIPLSDAPSRAAGNDPIKSLIQKATEFKRANDERALETAQRAVALVEAQGRKRGAQRALALIAELHIHANRLVEAKGYVHRAEVQALADGDWRCHASLHLLQNILAYIALDWKKSLFHVKRSIEIYAEHDEFYVAGYRGLARHYLESGLYAEVLETLQLISEAQKTGCKFDPLYFWAAKSLVYYHLKSYSQFTEANNRALALAKSLGSEEYVALCLERRACAAIEGSINGNPIADMEQCIAIQHKLKNQHYYTNSLVNFASILIELGKLKQGRQVLESATELAGKHKFFEVSILCLINHAKLCVKIQRYRDAHDFLHEALKHCDGNNFLRIQTEIHDRLAETSRFLGDSKGELFHTKRYMTLDQQLFGSSVLHKIVAIENRTELQQHLIHHEVLRLQNQKLRSQLDELNQQLAKMAAAVAQRNAALKSIQTQVKEKFQSEELVKGAPNEQLLMKIKQSLANEPSWTEFERLFTSVNGDFLNRLIQDFPDLTPGELKVCTLLKLNMSSQQIAQTLFLSAHTVNTHRQKIRRKLNLQKGTNLVSFLQQVVG